MNTRQNTTFEFLYQKKATLPSEYISEGCIVIEKSNFVSSSNALLPNLKECPFVVVCKPKDSNFIKLNPPKSISILGQTGWESAKTKANEGGGGLMS